MDLYRDPEAYDLVYQSGTADQFASLVKVASAHSVPGGPWLETACGSARLLVAAEAAGISAAGFDREPAMIEYARTRLSANADLQITNLESCAAVFGGRSFPFAFTLINTIRHLETDAAIHAHFGEMARLLAPGGIYVVGLSLADPVRDEIEEDVWRGSADGISVTELSTTLPAEPGSRSETIISHLTIERDDVPPEHRDTSFSLRTYTKAEWEGVVAASALTTVGTYDLWGDAAEAYDGRYVLYALTARTP